MENCDEKDQWDEVRCPICIEHPHNAVLLICASYKKGCRPFMCDTSGRHSNCFDQFCKLRSVTPSRSTDDQPNKFVGCGEGKDLDLEHACPLCRGQIAGWIVVEDARRYMNSIVRGCALESCEFSGNYVELRKHARLEHPTAKPSEVDKERQSDWERLERNWQIMEAFGLSDEDDELLQYDFSDQDLEGGEVNLEPLSPDNEFFNLIHCEDENETILREESFITNGIFNYTRTTNRRTIEYSMVL